MFKGAFSHLRWRNSYGTLRLLAGVASVVALLVYEWIPPKVLTLVPRATTQHSVYGYRHPNGEPTASWVDEAAEWWRCNFSFAEGYSCGYLVSWSQDRSRGMDLTEYQQLGIQLQYHGSDDARIRFFLRNFNPAYANPQRFDTLKFMGVSANVTDIKGYTTISMDRFAVGEWWLRAHQIPLALGGVEYDNVVAVGIDFLTEGEHQVVVERLELIGPRIAKEVYYLAILLFWLILIFAEGAVRVTRLWRKSRRAAQKIEALVTRYKSLEREKHEFEALSTVDALTGALNRTGFNRFWNNLNRAGEAAASGGLLIIDVDFFKQVNDSRGHDAGDRLLRDLAGVIQQNIRAEDVFVRWGGEEFVLLCPKLSEDNLLVLGEKLRAIVADTVFEPEAPLRMTISIGATLLKPRQGFEQAFKIADQALYRAKDAGRNRVVFWEG